MKIIDLLNKMANGEIKEETQIKMLGETYIYKEGYLTLNTKTMKELYLSQRLLNDEAEIIAEVIIEDRCECIDEEVQKLFEKDNKIEKIPINYADDRTDEEIYEYLRCSINQIIDKLNKESDE